MTKKKSQMQKILYSPCDQCNRVNLDCIGQTAAWQLGDFNPELCIRLIEDDGEEVCRVCGCTKYTACPGGCYWVEPGLCSACAELDPLKYPECNNVQCPFCGCMGDNTCKLFNIAQHSITYIEKYPDVLKYCNEPLKYIKRKRKTV